MLTLITASFTSAIPKNAPGEIVYIPVGTNKINATVSGKPGEITVSVPPEKGASIAASTPISPPSGLHNNVLRDTSQKAIS